ncbi:MAG: ParB N-terminal domain-containing protein [Anaerolineae bacterium]|nr:ParB N-terminal domain-containing protein [Anaerolineae bacterium]
MNGKKRQANSGLLDTITADMLGGGSFDIATDNSLRVERILLEMVRSDPVQPRRVLPERIYQAFHTNRMTPTQALRELIQTAQLAARQNGRPFTNVLDLLGNPDDETETEAPQLSPEEQLVRDLVNLAVTIRDDGQVNPLTVVDVTQGVTRLYRIETGERRYWATWLLRDFIPGYESDGMIPCIIIPSERASAFRQAKENTARTGLSAIAMARQAALLLLYVHGCEIPHGPVTHNFYQQALELDLRGKREYTEQILSAMGGIKKAYFSTIKALLYLSDEAVEIADRHNIEEGKLRHVITLSPEFHLEVVQQIVDFNLTSKQVKELCRADGQEPVGEDPLSKLSASAVKIARIAQSINATSAHDLAQALIAQEGNRTVAIARLQAFRQLIGEAEQLLEER